MAAVTSVPSAGSSQSKINAWWQQNIGNTVNTNQGLVTVSGNPPAAGTFNFQVSQGGWSVPPAATPAAAPAGAAPTAGSGGTAAPNTASSSYGPPVNTTPAAANMPTPAPVSAALSAWGTPLGLSQAQLGQIAGAGFSMSDLQQFQNQGLSFNDIMQKASTAAGTGTVTNSGGTSYNNPNQLPQQNALGLINAIDPQSGALTSQLAGSYAPALTRASAFAANTPGQQLQIEDPATAALTAQQAAAQKTYLQQGVDFNAHPGQLTPELAREVTQAAEGQEAQSGNIQGAGEAAVTGMQVGQAGINLAEQQQTYENNALNENQSYLQSGATSQAQKAQMMAQQQAYLSNTQNLANSYLSGSATPIAQSQNYLNTAMNQASAASSGGPVYSPAAQPPSYTYLNPNSGAATAAGTQGFMAQGTGATLGSPNTLTPALTGAAGGAASGALAGSAAGPYGTLIGGAVGAIGGGLSGYYGASCWVAREVFGVENPQWVLFREWMLNRSPKWFKELYLKYGERFAIFIRNKPRLKSIIRDWMSRIIEADQNKQRCDKVQRIS